MSETLYYLFINGEQRGPFPKYRLIEEGLTSQTMVWREGLEEWVEAHTLEDLSGLVSPPEAPGYSQPSPGYQQPPYQQQGGQQAYQQPYQEAPQQPYQQPYQQAPQQPYQQTYQQPYQPVRVPGTYPPGWTNWLAWAIVATVLGLFGYVIFSIPGIVGIVKANQANTMARMGDPRAADVNQQAKTWTIIGLALTGLIILIVIFVMIFGFWAITTAIGLSDLNY